MEKDLQQRDLFQADQQANEPLGALGHIALAEVYIRHSRLEKALVQYQKALAQACIHTEANDALCALMGMASIHHQQGNFRTAIQSYAHAAQFCALDPSSRAWCHNGTGLNYYKMGAFDKAMEAFKEMLDTATDASGEQYYLEVATACIGLAGTAFHSGKYELAAEHGEHALEVADAHGDTKLVTEASLALGNIHFCLQQTQIALDFYQKSLDISEANSDPRNQCRALCGAGLCYYAAGEHQAVAKIFQTALARDKLVPPYDGSSLPSIGEQMVDEQLLFLLHWTLREHAPQVKIRDLMGTMYLGLTAVLMNGGGILTPSSLPQGLLDTVVRSLLASSSVEPISPAFSRYSPYLQQYCVHILQQCVRQKALRPLIATQDVADGLLLCMAYPTDPAAGTQAHSAAYKALKALISCPSSTLRGDDMVETFLRSTCLTNVLELLSKHTKPAQDAQQRQVLDILTALSTLLCAYNTSSKVPTSPLHGFRLGTPNAPDMTAIITAVCGVANIMIDEEVFVEANLQALELCLRILMHICKRVVAMKALVLQRLEPRKIESLGAALPLHSSIPMLTAELCKLLKESGEGRSYSGYGFRSDDGNSAEDCTTFGSLSSQSSLVSGIRPTVTLHRLSFGADTSIGDDTEDITGLEDSWLDDSWLA